MPKITQPENGVLSCCKAEIISMSPHLQESPNLESSLGPVPCWGWCNLPPRQECAWGPLSQPPVAVTASRMWRSEQADGSPDVVYFLWLSVTCIPHCQAGVGEGTAHHSLHGVPLHGSGSFSRTWQGLALLRLHCLGAGSSGLFFFFPILLTHRESFGTAVLNPLVHHDTQCSHAKHTSLGTSQL